MTTDIKMTQKCRSCGVEQPLSEFYYRKDNQKHRTECKSCNHNDQLLRRQGIELAEYDRMFEEQNGVCLICDQPQRSKRNTRLCVDHDHDTGQIRGLLCDACNRGIGLLNDDFNRLERAAKYLRAAKIGFQDLPTGTVAST